MIRQMPTLMLEEFPELMEEIMKALGIVIENPTHVGVVKAPKRTGAEKRKLAKTIAALREELKDPKAVAAIRAMLMQIDVSDFDPMETPPGITMHRRQ